MNESNQKQQRAPKRRLTEEQRDRFLEVLGQTGNRAAAAQAIGADPRCMDQRREFDPVLDRLWDAAIEQADRRLSGANGPFDCIGAREFNVIKRGPTGHLQLARSGPKRWNAAVEERFFATLGMCGNIAAAARAVGFSESCIVQRRRKWPDFAQRLEEALEDAELNVEFRMASMANDSGVRVDGSVAAAAEGVPAPLAFDPDLAMRFLKWRQEKRLGRSKVGRPWRRPRSMDEMRESILKKLKAIAAHDRDEDDGWIQDEQGNWIPPGWVRAGDG